MNELTSRISQTFKPRLAIVAYTGASDNWDGAYLESHEISKEGAFLEGKPLRQETIQAIVDVFFDERQNRLAVHGLLPVNVLFYEILPGGHYTMIWHRPAERRRIHFHADLNIKSGEAWVPAILYKVERNRLSVFALAKDDRPSEETPLYVAPFHNIYVGGEVCLGNAKLEKPKDRTYPALTKYWEDMFWLSEFSHLNGSVNPTKTNINLLWQRLIRDKKLTWSQLKELKKDGRKKVKDIL